MLDAGALLFDMDGLLVDSGPMWFEVERAFAEARGGNWTRTLAHACVGTGLPNTLVVMGNTFGFEVDPLRDQEAVLDAFIERVGELSLKPGAAEFLAESHGRVPTALVSSSILRVVDATLARFGIGSRFDAMVSGDSVVRVKPAPDIFLKAADILGVCPSRCVVLEDSLPGVCAARAAGMRVIAVPERDPQLFAEVADRVVDDLFGARACLRF